MAKFTAGADEINSGNAKEKAYVVDSRMDMLKMASPISIVKTWVIDESSYF